MADTVWTVLKPVLDQLVGLMIELRGVSKTVPSGAGTLTILHPLDLVVPARPGRRDHRAVGQRQVDAARPDCRPRLRRRPGSIAIDGVDITALDEDAPRAAARRGGSASSSSSFTCCRR